MGKCDLFLAPLVLEKEGGGVPKRKRCVLAVRGSGEGAAVGRLQSPLRALAVVRFSQSQPLPKALG